MLLSRLHRTFSDRITRWRARTVARAVTRSLRRTSSRVASPAAASSESQKIDPWHDAPVFKSDSEMAACVPRSSTKLGGTEILSQAIFHDSAAGSPGPSPIRVSSNLNFKLNRLATRSPRKPAATYPFRKDRKRPSSSKFHRFRTAFKLVSLSRGAAVPVPAAGARARTAGGAAK